MYKALKTEIWKSTHNNFFRGTILIGLIIVLLNVVESAYRVNLLTGEIEKYIAADIPISKSIQGFSLFVSWMPVHPSGLGSGIFYFIWPILAAMPYTWSYTQERHCGLYNQIVTRESKSTYFFSKYVAVFISGGIAIALPISIDLLLTALVCPMCVPDVTKSLVPLMNVSFLSGLYYTKPWLYALIWCIVEFLWGGVVAGACLAVGAKLRVFMMVTIVPFVFLTFCDFSISLLCYLIKTKKPFSIMQMARAASTAYNPYWAIPTTICLLLLLTIPIGFLQVKTSELD